MPNQQGGKNYKKSKHSTGEQQGKIQEADAREGQMYGRIVKVLGNLCFQVYGNDGRIRICKVCGAMRKRIWINMGDIVIISLREFEVSDKVIGVDRVKQTERGDIIYKFEQSLLSKAKKIEGINQSLFIQLETVDKKVLSEMADREPQEEDGDFFDAQEKDADEEAEEVDIDNI